MLVRAGCYAAAPRFSGFLPSLSAIPPNRTTLDVSLRVQGTVGELSVHPTANPRRLFDCNTRPQNSANQRYLRAS